MLAPSASLKTLATGYLKNQQKPQTIATFFRALQGGEPDCFVWSYGVSSGPALVLWSLVLLVLAATDMFLAVTLLHGYPFLGEVARSLLRAAWGIRQHCARCVDIGFRRSANGGFFAPGPMLSLSWAVPRAGNGVCYCKPGFV